MQRSTSRVFKSFLFFLTLLLTSGLSFSQTDIDQGVTLFEENKLPEAKSFFENYLKSNKKDPEANFYLGRIYFDQDDFGKATDWIGKAAKYDKNNSKYYMWLGHAYGRRTQEASRIRQPFLAKDSRKNYEKAIETDPNNVEARQSAMEFYLQAPGFMGGGRDKAEAQATAISDIDEIAGVMAWGRVYTYYDEVDNAMSHYTSAIEMYPEEMGPYYRLFNFHFNEQDYTSAIEIANKQLSNNDTTAAIYLNLGNALQRNEQYDEALEAYYTTMELDSTFYNTWYQIGRLSAVSGMHLETGKEYIESFIAQGDLVNDNTMAWAYFRLGTIYEHMNDTPMAKTQYENALKKDKKHEQSKEALTRLR